jgi:hypothetical protein
MQRRTLLKWGVGGALVLAAGGGAVALFRPAWQAGKLTAVGRDLMAAVARTVLAGMLPSGPEAETAAMNAHLARVEDTIKGFPSYVQAEIEQLLNLLGTAAGRRLLVGVAEPWAQASPQAIGVALDDMRQSSLALRLQAYHALRDLTHGAYYADASTWSSLGYPGPLRVG